MPIGSNPRVSVIIATYNMGQFLAEAIQSILNQTFQDLEVIVVDDGSTDNTQVCLERFRTDTRVIIVTQRNLGQPRAKNVGIERARGSYIAFCDADDYWLPQKLELQLPRFNHCQDIGVVYSPATALFPDGSRAELQGPKYMRGDVLHTMFVRNIVPFGTAVVRRECIDQLGAFDESFQMGIDWDLWLRISTRWKFDYVEEATYIYRIWDGQMSKNWRGRYDCALAIMEKFLAQYPNRLPAAVVASAYADTYTNLASHHLAHFGIRKCLATLAKAFRCKPGHWPAWRLLMTLPYYRVRAIMRS